MDFGRIPDISRVDFALPADNAVNAGILGGARHAEPRVHVGLPIWGDAALVGTLYPPDAKEKDYLKWYAREISCIELNSSFYRMPSPSTLEMWAEKVPEDFRFYPKLPQTVSRSAPLEAAIGELRESLEAFGLLGPKLALPFLQLPPGFHLGHGEQLLRLIDAAGDARFAVEFRHASFFAPGERAEALFGALEERSVPLVIADTAGHRELVHMRLGARRCIVRFNAHDEHPSDYERMSAWARHIAVWIDAGLEELAFIVHTTQRGLGPGLVNFMIARLNAEAGLALRPARLRAHGEQQSLF